MADLGEVTAEAPSNLRDLLWFPVKLRYRGANAEEPVSAHLPALAPRSWAHRDPGVRLGRVSVLELEESGETVPFGSKLLISGEQYVPLVDVRTLRTQGR